MSTPPPAQQPADTESEMTGLPGVQSWRMVYALVVIIITCFIVLLTMLTRWFQ